MGINYYVGYMVSMSGDLNLVDLDGGCSHRASSLAMGVTGWILPPVIVVQAPFHKAIF